MPMISPWALRIGALPARTHVMPVEDLYAARIALRTSASPMVLPTNEFLVRSDSTSYLDDNAVAFLARGDSAFPVRIGVGQDNLNTPLAIAGCDRRSHDACHRHEEIRVRRENVIDTP